MKTMNSEDPDPERISITGRLYAAPWLFVLGSLMVVFAFLAFPTHAAELWRMDGFSTRIDVRLDGTLLVEETVEANFLEARHGIYRYVPYRGRTTDGEAYRIAIRLIGVTDEYDVAQHVRETREGNNVVWRIGDPDVTMTGPQTYVITYEVRDAVLRLEDHDELFWNVSGEGWDVALPNLKVTVEYPEIDEKEIELRCFTGGYGSTAEDCFSIKAPSFSGFTTERAGDPMSVAVLWPKGHIGTESLAVRLARLFATHWYFSLPFLALAFYWSAWKEHGDDDESRAIVPEYEPPFGLRPAAVNALLKQSSNAKDLAPTIVDLAVRGFLTIEELDKPWYKGGDDYLLKTTGKAWEDAEPFEKLFLFNLFGAAKEKKISELKDTFYRHIPTFTESVISSLVEKGYYEARPTAVRVKWIGGGLACLFLLVLLIIGISSRSLGLHITLVILAAIVLLLWHGIRKSKRSSVPRHEFGAVLTLLILVFTLIGRLSGFESGSIDGGLIVSIVITSVIIIGFGWAMPRWTPHGLVAVHHAKGFKLFISKVKKYRTEWEEKENIFESVLPYALAFGLGKKWASAFAGLQQQAPSWYVGAQAGTWNALAFESSLSSMTKSFTTSASSSPSSRGGSGGGFSGGGFGGGGGGSW